jgi:hypothetical protein
LRVKLSLLTTFYDWEVGMRGMVTIPAEEYRRRLAIAEEAEARLAAGEEELIPAAVVDRLLAGESPVKGWCELRGFSQSRPGPRIRRQPGGDRRH